MAVIDAECDGKFELRPTFAISSEQSSRMTMSFLFFSASPVFKRLDLGSLRASAWLSLHSLSSLL